MTTEVTLESLPDLLRDDDRVQVAVVDIDGVLRGKIMAKEKFLSAAKDGFGFCGVVHGWDIHDTPYSPELSVSNLANGYRDLLARVDLHTFRRTHTTPALPFFLCTLLDPETREGLYADPRAVLQRVCRDLAEEGYEAMAGAEYEYFQFKETPTSLYDKDFHNLTPLTKGMHGYSLLRPEANGAYFHALFDNCATMGIPIEGHHTETGPGVFESALAYCPVERMADNAVLFKHVARTTGLAHGIIPTFMAKPYGDQPGCSGHVHISLRDSEGRNVFAVRDDEVKDGRADAQYDDTKRISQVGEWFLAGILDGLPDIMPCLVPTVNGYKRLVESYWAPTTVSYAYESRLASVRVISPPLGDAKATRLEVRVPGADMNPYLTFASLIALGLRGIRQRLALPGPPIAPTTSAETLARLRLPRSLDRAVEGMLREGSIATEVLGRETVEHLGATR
ncbi:hypothetical protein JCM3770_000753, partial [Rhodotorula araucariae]